MRKVVFLIALCFALCAHAETLILRTGARVKGTIIFQNEEVVIVRNDEGARFQYPRANVAEILSDDAVEEQEDKSETETLLEDPDEADKKASILLELAGGAAVKPNEVAGGAASVDLLVGSHHIGSRHLFIGGGIGYHGIFIGGEKYNFLPIQVAVRMPFVETKHAPVFGVALGYSLAFSRDYFGGLYAGVDFGYRCQLNPRSAIALVAFAQFQQAGMQVTSIIDGIAFTNMAGRNLVTTGLKLAIYL